MGQAVSQERLKRRRGRRATFFLPHNPVVCAHGEKRTRLFGLDSCAHTISGVRTRREQDGKRTPFGKKSLCVRTTTEGRTPVMCAHAKHQTYTHEHACDSLFRYHRFSTAMKA